MAARAELALITGVTGFAGGFHVDEATSQGIRVIGVGRNEVRLRELGASYPGLIPVQLDVAKERGRVEELVREYRPAFIIHLAAQSDPAVARTDPEGTFQNNSLASENLLEAVRIHSPSSTVVMTTSAYIYGETEGELVEGMPLNPHGAYAVSKENDINLMERYRSYGLSIVEARVFNHFGPGKKAGFQTKIMKEIIEAELEGKPARVKVLSLQYARDIQHPTNWAQASLILARQGVNSTYHVSSGSPVTWEQFIAAIRDELGIEIEVTEDPNQAVGGTPLVMWGNNSRLKQETGWTPAKGFGEMMAESVAYWHDEQSRQH